MSIWICLFLVPVLADECCACCHSYCHEVLPAQLLLPDPHRRSNAEAHFRPAPAEVDGEEATIWYFAFGSNINKKVFEGRRRIKPADSLPAVLPGWRLEFNQPGLPYTEPAFAAVERQPEASNGEKQMDVHGIAHRITPTQVRAVDSPAVCLC